LSECHEVKLDPVQWLSLTCGCPILRPSQESPPCRPGVHGGTAMPLTLMDVVRRIRDDVAVLLESESLRQLCRDNGHRWRQRLLDPVTTIHLFVLQVLHGNTACAHLPHLSGLSFTESAYCQARSRLPLAVLRAVLRRV